MPAENPRVITTVEQAIAAFPEGTQVWRNAKKTIFGISEGKAQIYDLPLNYKTGLSPYLYVKDIYHTDDPEYNHLQGMWPVNDLVTMTPQEVEQFKTINSSSINSS